MHVLQRYDRWSLFNTFCNGKLSHDRWSLFCNGRLDKVYSEMAGSPMIEEVYSIHVPQRHARRSLFCNGSHMIDEVYSAVAGSHMIDEVYSATAVSPSELNKQYKTYIYIIHLSSAFLTPNTIRTLIHRNSHPSELSSIPTRRPPQWIWNLPWCLARPRLPLTYIRQQ